MLLAILLIIITYTPFYLTPFVIDRIQLQEKKQCLTDPPTFGAGPLLHNVDEECYQLEWHLGPCTDGNIALTDGTYLQIRQNEILINHSDFVEHYVTDRRDVSYSAEENATVISNNQPILQFTTSRVVGNETQYFFHDPDIISFTIWHHTKWGDTPNSTLPVNWRCYFAPHGLRLTTYEDNFTLQWSSSPGNDGIYESTEKTYLQVFQNGVSNTSEFFTSCVLGPVGEVAYLASEDVIAIDLPNTYLNFTDSIFQVNDTIIFTIWEHTSYCETLHVSLPVLWDFEK